MLAGEVTTFYYMFLVYYDLRGYKQLYKTYGESEMEMTVEPFSVCTFKITVIIYDRRGVQWAAWIVLATICYMRCIIAVR